MAGSTICPRTTILVHMKLFESLMCRYPVSVIRFVHTVNIYPSVKFVCTERVDGFPQNLQGYIADGPKTSQDFGDLVPILKIAGILSQQ